MEDSNKEIRKLKSEFSIDVELTGMDKIKAELQEIENQLDRIITKYERTKGDLNERT